MHIFVHFMINKLVLRHILLYLPVHNYFYDKYLSGGNYLSILSMDFLIKTAFRIGAVGGICTVIAINSVPYLLNSRIKDSDHYKEALKLLQSHPEAVKHLGEPIVTRRIDTSNKEDYGIDENRMWFKIPLKGPNGKGKLFYDCTTKKNANDPYKLLNVELTLDNIKNYKLVIKKSE